MVRKGFCVLAGVLLFQGCAKRPPAKEVRSQGGGGPATAAMVPSDLDTVRDAHARIQALISEAFRPIYFPYDQSDLTEEAKAILSRAGDLLKRETSITLLIEGNTDERGTDAYNLALGHRRASMARDYLANYGVQASRIRLTSYGEEKPARPGHAEQDWALNRRDEFEVTF